MFRYRFFYPRKLKCHLLNSLFIGFCTDKGFLTTLGYYLHMTVSFHGDKATQKTAVQSKAAK